MKCPKCSYLSFEAGERCRNCGYDFSMATPQADDPAGDLPLFDDRPLVSVPASPRPPLSVRRTTQDPARLRQRHGPPAVPQPPRDPELDLAFEEEPAADAVDERDDMQPPMRGAATRAAAIPDARAAASGVRRLIAALIDATLIVATDVTVVYLTIRAAGQDWDSFALPVAPIAAFLLILNGGYFVMFTAATGQTIGKMAADIRVVGAPREGREEDAILPRVTFGRAVVRTAGYLVSLLPAGLGFLPAFVGPREHRALHDRIAGTRVVRA